MGVARAQASGYQDTYNKLATEDSTHSIPFYGPHQAGIATPPQTAAAFLAFDVTARTRWELGDLFRTLTERAAFLTKGGTPPPSRPGKPPEHRYLLGATVLPDDLTVTVALGASLFDGRYGLAPRKPASSRRCGRSPTTTSTRRSPMGICWCSFARTTATPSATPCSTSWGRPGAACVSGGARMHSDSRHDPWAYHVTGWGSKTASPTPTPPTPHR
jgi:hypothetical protein